MKEYNASEIRTILQKLFPARRLVLSQFTFFNQIGVAKPTGRSFRRGRQCYRLEDILPIAAVLGLKEEGIPLKNIETAPMMIREKSSLIFKIGSGCKLSGWGDIITLNLPISLEDGDQRNLALESFLDNPTEPKLYWTYDLGELASQILEIVHEQEVEIRRAA